MRHLARRTGLLALLLVAVGLAAGAIAYATIPSSNGTITGCYSASDARQTGGTELNIVDTQYASCGQGQKTLQWS